MRCNFYKFDASNKAGINFFSRSDKMTISEPIHVTDAAFEKVVLQSSLPVIVDFWAPWCGPCRMVAPILDKIAKEYADKLIVAKVNTDENPEWAGRFGVQGIPTMLFVANGKVVHEQVGALPEGVLRDVVQQFLDFVASLDTKA
jgi:thioredoxin 1